MVVVVVLEDGSELVFNDGGEALKEREIFELVKEALVLSETRGTACCLPIFVVFLAFGLDVDGFEGSNRGPSEVVPQELEVDLIGDPSIMVQIDNFEPIIQQFLTGLHLDVVQDIVDCEPELFPTHDALAALRIHFLAVSALDGHLSEVLLSAEISQLMVGDFAIVVAVISEDIVSHVLQLVLVLLQ